MPNIKPVYLSEQEQLTRAETWHKTPHTFLVGTNSLRMSTHLTATSQRENKRIPYNLSQRELIVTKYPDVAALCALRSWCINNSLLGHAEIDLDGVVYASDAVKQVLNEHPSEEIGQIHQVKSFRFTPANEQQRFFTTEAANSLHHFSVTAAGIKLLIPNLQEAKDPKENTFLRHRLERFDIRTNEFV